MAFVMRVFLIFGAMSGCISYVIFFVTFFEEAIGDTLPTVVYLIFALCIIFPITMVNELRGLVKFSSLANGIVFLTVVSILTMNMIDIFTDSDEPTSPW